MPESFPQREYDSVAQPPVITPVRTPVTVPPPIRVPGTDIVATPNSNLRDEDRWRRYRDARYWIFTGLPSGLSSAVIHLLILIALAIFLVTPQLGSNQISIEIIPIDSAVEEPLLETAVAIESFRELEVAEQPRWEPTLFERRADLVPIELASEQIGVDGPLLGPESLALRASNGSGGGRDGVANEEIAGRLARRQSALAYGATVESENAVRMALDWIIRHQCRDGSWNFNHRAGLHSCQPCRCGNPSSLSRAENGATAMGLLPLLGAGDTHLQGTYREQAARGLRFLIDHQEADGSFMDQEGNMYSHGLATLAICEALAMTRQLYRPPNPRPASVASAPYGPEEIRSGNEVPDDQPLGLLHAPGSTIELSELKSAAQRAIEFIERAQHSRGGWRYQPGQPGDTSVVGWQMMALKSGQLARLDITPRTVAKAVSFLDHVSDDPIGSCYGYTSGRRKANQSRITAAGATTAIGLLCRMYTGWNRDRRGIRVGVARLSRSARPNQGLYFYYYATQVMHHDGGQPWQEWNQWMREHLVKQQCRGGTETGSWQLGGPHDDTGRLYCTSLAAMTLEIYYRYIPIYSETAVEHTASRDE